MANIHESVFIADGAIVKGNVTIGEDSSVWYNAVVRIEKSEIIIGKRTNIQDCCVIHGDEDFPVYIGDNVTVGHTAIIHGCTIKSNTLIGMGAVVLNGAVIGENCVVGAGALVTEGTIIPDGSLFLGSPAKVKRQVVQKDLDLINDSADVYVKEAKEEMEQK